MSAVPNQPQKCGPNRAGRTRGDGSIHISAAVYQPQNWTASRRAGFFDLTHRTTTRLGADYAGAQPTNSRTRARSVLPLARAVRQGVEPPMQTRSALPVNFHTAHYLARQSSNGPEHLERPFNTCGSDTENRDRKGVAIVQQVVGEVRIV